ncbi:MFS transporter [Sphingopyxis witflariensis]|uniref:MFS transporter n=1 Tax=Sphingopyxis witflariensis TaxID=173675 RepID=A0A246K3L3_9SPHN|nr:MFS transporter [Sphingopyxis witflariensis]OWR00147.1 MFS transporter [Sphingopyxis witflariensis]
MIDRLNRLFRVNRGEWPKLVQFGLFGFLLQMGLGIGFSAGDAAFLSHVGADKLPIIFMLTPLVMLVYTGIFSVLMVRFSIDQMVTTTLLLLVIGGLLLWALLGSTGGNPTLYYALKLYLAMWYIGLYSLFWNYTDAYFDIQDAKRLFPLFAAFCALGTAAGAMIVNLTAAAIPIHGFMALWAAIALATIPLARMLGRRWQQIAESDADAGDEPQGVGAQLALLANSFRTSRYTVALTATLFVTLLMTNLAEFQYSTVLQVGRSEAELAALFGALYAASNIFNLIVCLFVFNRLVSRFGVRNIAFILPLTYFATFGLFFLSGGYAAAIAAFFAYHAVLTSIEYNNQNLLFNAVPSAIKRPLRTVIEGMCEPLASLIAGAFLLYAATRLDLRELSGIGVILGAALIAVVVLLRQLYPAAMTANMRRGWLNFGDPALTAPTFTPDAAARLQSDARSGDRAAQSLLGPTYSASTASEGDVDALIMALRNGDDSALDGLHDLATADDIHLVPLLADRLGLFPRSQRQMAIALIGRIGDVEAIPGILTAARTLAPRDRRAIAAMLAGLGDTAIPHLVAGLRDRRRDYSERSIAAHALAELSYAQFNAQLERLVDRELTDARALIEGAASTVDGSAALTLLFRARRERAEASIDFTLELLALGGLLPNFDLLIVSLHSSNPKVRGNALEAIESGVGHALFRKIDAILHPRGEATSATEVDIVALAEAALDSGRWIETAAALAILHDRLPPTGFARQTSRLVRADMPAVLRRQLLRLLGLENDDGPDMLALVDALSRMPGFSAATLRALADLAAAARAVIPDRPAIHGHAAGHDFWIANDDIMEVASRHPDLALVMLRVQDGRAHAA